MTTQLGQVTVIGCGLIGGSIVKSLSRGCDAARICAIDREQVLSAARPYLADASPIGTPHARELVAASDLVILAMPVGAILQSVGWVLDTIGPRCVVTDTGSVKKAILLAAQQSPHASRFVAGHPMAGREMGGFEASTATLFEGARWFCVSDGNDLQRRPDARAVATVISLAHAVGAEPVAIDVAAHDRAMAYVSHAPQLVASALYAVAAQNGALAEAGPGFRDLTRIAGGPASTWRTIFETNRSEIASALRQLLEPLDDLRDQLAKGDEQGIAAAIALLERAHLAREALGSGSRAKS